LQLVKNVQVNLKPISIEGLYYRNNNKKKGNKEEESIGLFPNIIFTVSSTDVGKYKQEIVIIKSNYIKELKKLNLSESNDKTYEKKNDKNNNDEILSIPMVLRRQNESLISPSKSVAEKQDGGNESRPHDKWIPEVLNIDISLSTDNGKEKVRLGTSSFLISYEDMVDKSVKLDLKSDNTCNDAKTLTNGRKNEKDKKKSPTLKVTNLFKKKKNKKKSKENINSNNNDDNIHAYKLKSNSMLELLVNTIDIDKYPNALVTNNKMLHQVRNNDVNPPKEIITSSAHNNIIEVVLDHHYELNHVNSNKPNGKELPIRVEKTAEGHVIIKLLEARSSDEDLLDDADDSCVSEIAKMRRLIRRLEEELDKTESISRKDTNATDNNNRNEGVDKNDPVTTFPKIDYATTVLVSQRAFESKDSKLVIVDDKHNNNVKKLKEVDEVIEEGSILARYFACSICASSLIDNENGDYNDNSILLSNDAADDDDTIQLYDNDDNISLSQHNNDEANCHDKEIDNNSEKQHSCNNTRSTKGGARSKKGGTVSTTMGSHSKKSKAGATSYTSFPSKTTVRSNYKNPTQSESYTNTDNVFSASSSSTYSSYLYTTTTTPATSSEIEDTYSSSSSVTATDDDDDIASLPSMSRVHKQKRNNNKYNRYRKFKKKTLSSEIESEVEDTEEENYSSISKAKGTKLVDVESGLTDTDVDHTTTTNDDEDSEEDSDEDSDDDTDSTDSYRSRSRRSTSFIR